MELSGSKWAGYGPSGARKNLNRHSIQWTEDPLPSMVLNPCMRESISALELRRMKNGRAPPAYQPTKGLIGRICRTKFAMETWIFQAPNGLDMAHLVPERIWTVTRSWGWRTCCMRENGRAPGDDRKIFWGLQYET